MKNKEFNIMKKRFLAALFCLCLLVGLVPGMGTTAFAAGSYNIGDTVTFAGHDWYIIGTESDGVKAPSGCYTLFAKNNDFGSTAFRAGAESTNSTANYYKNSDLQKKMEEIASGFSAGDKASIVARDTLDGIAGDAVNDQLLWPVSEAEWNGIDKSLRAFPADYWTRESWEGDVGALDAPRYVYRVHKALADGRKLDGNAGFLVRPPEVTETFAIRPALYVKAEALPEKVEGIQVAFGGQWWYVVGQGKKGSVPGPENTVTLFENPREKLGAQPVSAYTSASSYLKSFLQEEMAVFGSKYLNLAGKESSLIVPRTLTSADGINGQTAHDQPFWPLSKDEADRTDSEILKSELYDDVSSVGCYWLRTTNNAGGFSFVYAVQGTDGKVVSDTQNKYYGVRPAFYLDISDAFYLAKDVKRVTIGGNPYPLVFGEGFDDLEEYKYTIFDDSLKLSVTAAPTQAAQTGETLSFGYAANTGENQYLSCVLTPDDSTDVLYYNKLVELSDTAAASGTVNIPLTGVSDGNYTLRLYTEQENNRSTDFASRAVNVKITVKDGVASIRDLGNIQLVGDSGGQDGREVELRTNEETRQIQWKYTDEPDTAWRDLVALDAITGGDGADGADGREVELQVANGYIQWRYTTGEDTAWKNLMPLSDLKGEDGEDGREVELKNDGSSILWRYVGEGDDAWRPLVDLSDITGSDGADGKQVELRVEGGYIQWKYDADSDWQNLIALSALQGIKGDKGDMRLQELLTKQGFVDAFAIEPDGHPVKLRFVFHGHYPPFSACSAVPPNRQSDRPCSAFLRFLPAVPARRQSANPPDTPRSPASGRLPQTGHPEHLPASWVRTAPSSFPEDADNHTAPADSALPPAGMLSAEDAPVWAGQPPQGACPGQSQNPVPASALPRNCSGQTALPQGRSHRRWPRSRSSKNIVHSASCWGVDPHGTDSCTSRFG